MKKLIPILLLAVFAFVACEKDPDMGKLDDKYLVYTNYDKSADFKTFEYFYIPDSILEITDKSEPTYLTGEGAQQIIAAYVDNMVARGYVQVDNEDDADLGIQVSYIKSLYYFTDYGYSDWWHNYPGYWGYNNYWGYYGGGWNYPYAVSYSYSTNSFLTEMVNLTTAEGATCKLPVVWTSYLTGLETGSTMYNRTLAVDAVNQSFKQSTYLSKN